MRMDEKENNIPEKAADTNTDDSRGLSDKINEAIGSLKGMSGKIVKKILNNAFLVKVLKIADKHLLKKYINSTAQKAVFQITGIIGLILSIILLGVMLIPFFITLAVGGKIIIPIIVFAVITALNWLIICIITNKITDGISNLLYSKLSPFQNSSQSTTSP